MEQAIKMVALQQTRVSNRNNRQSKNELILRAHIQERKPQ
jgi:hypothetical protein